MVWTSPGGQTVTTPAELDTLALPPPEPDPDNDHPDGHWIRPLHELLRQDPPAPAVPDPSPQPVASLGNAEIPPF